MLAVRTSGDFVALLEGAIWLLLAWSASYSAAIGEPLPSVAMLSIAGTLVFVCWAHRPFRLTLQRYRIRRRRTEMLMHIIALPLLLALFFGVLIESLLTPLSGQQKMLMYNVLATSGWLVFALTLLIKYLMFRLRSR
ncbi:hypothetical protein SAMN05192555_101138 [Franzmannia pantelleriensis]|uniref:Transmembrane protein n=1 Tax=Franzmannia pantelleriensis TaxID=48727 RepID=A0A1G9EJU9_9GAMM|nr:hypothetical protein [Halomonas pantelleriensis]SDK76404.1 hypothetical protein SAMN05192555_101138 [Halomonas pantelleriensis]